jgi:cyclopropane-fatty-acyl-phospholipid synthase
VDQTGKPALLQNKTTHYSECLLERLLEHYHPRNFGIRLWDGTTWHADPGVASQFTLIIRDPSVLRKMLWNANELSLAEAFISGELDIEGNLEQAIPLAEYLSHSTVTWGSRLRLGFKSFSLPSSKSSKANGLVARLTGVHHSLNRDKQAIAHHYDHPAEFYATWLDQQMVYSCAYFSSTDDLDTAQARKLDYICKKLRLRRGERLLDVGCGWGALILHAARHYGVYASGITLSAKQAEFANALITKNGLMDRCRVELRDYRQLNSPNRYDKIVSVGMIEHVGEAQLPGYFHHIWNLLKPGGTFLNHGIGIRHGERCAMGPFFNKYIFPDAELVPISTTTRLAETAGFEVRDIECLREHYVLTLRRWRQRLESNVPPINHTMDESAWRLWRLYLATAAHGFATGRLNLYQTLLSKTQEGATDMPLTRDDWYDTRSSNRPLPPHIISGAM